jgi:hypothetical protein
MSSNREPITVPLPPPLRAYVREVAERELIPQAAVVRRLILAAARSEQTEGKAA